MSSSSFEELASWIRNGRHGDLSAFLEDCHFDINNSEDLTGNTLLHIACQNGSKTMVKICLRNGSHMNLQNKKGRTPLHHCILYGFQELAQYLVSKGANDALADMDGYTCYEAALATASSRS